MMTPLNCEHVAYRCAGHSCQDRNRCDCHILPVPDGLVVIWQPWYEDREGNKCEHFRQTLE